MRSCSSISVVVPLLNEEDNVEELYAQLRHTIEKLNLEMQVVFVDDGSTDRTADRIATLKNSDERIVGIQFTRNFGHQIALYAGMKHSTGDIIVTMDGDLQHPVSLIPELVGEWSKGIDVVQAVRIDARQASFLKKISSRFFYRFINLLGQVKIDPNAADFRLIGRNVLQSLLETGEHSLFLRGLIPWMGYGHSTVKYEAPERFRGSTKYSLWKMFRLAIDGIMGFSTFPLRLSLLSGLVISSLSFIYALYALYQRVANANVISGWTSLLISVLFIGGVQLIMVGILGEYVAKIYDQVRNRPLYVVKRVI